MLDQVTNLKQAFSILRENGTEYFLRKLFRRTKSIFYQNFEGFIHQLEFSIFNPIIHPKIHVDIKVLDRAEADQLTYAYGDEKKQARESLLDRLDKGYTCIIARSSDRIVSSVWFAIGEVYLPKLSGRLFSKHKNVKLNEYESIVYDTHTLSEYRGQNIAPALYSIGVEHLKKLGIKTFYCTTGIDNFASMRCIEKVGFKPLKKVRYKRMLFMQKRYIELLSEDTNHRE